MKRFFTIAMLVAFTGALSAGEWEVVKPLIADKLISARLTQQEMTGGEIDRRIMDLIYRNFTVLNLDRDWPDKFRNRTARGDNLTEVNEELRSLCGLLLESRAT